MLQETLKKFGFPDTFVKEYEHWTLLCRDEQQTLGSLILVSKQEVTTISELRVESWSELFLVIQDIEKTLNRLFQYDRINYLAFMMYNPLVHMSIIPRYASDREFESQVFYDYSWPGLPDLSRLNVVDASMHKKITEHLRKGFSE